MYSVIKNISSSPLLENLIVGAQDNNNTPQIDMDLANLRINLKEYPIINQIASKFVVLNRLINLFQHFGMDHYLQFEFVQ